MPAPPDFRHGRQSTRANETGRSPSRQSWPTENPSESPRFGDALANESHVPSPGKRAVTAPDFVIIGAQRGGTTSLHAYLGAHPQVETPATKELHFITDRHERGLDWYLGQFPAELAPDVITGEATPYALFHPLAPQRLREVAPAARLIALLRNPVDRAYSHYLLERSGGHETLDFAAALDAEQERLDGEEARLASEPTYASAPHKHASYLARGDYARQLERWFAVFPREQILVVRSEDLYERSAETLALVVQFLGISLVGTDPVHGAQPIIRASPRSCDARPVIAALRPVECSLGRSARLGPRLGLTPRRLTAFDPLTWLSPVCHGCRV